MASPYVIIDRYNLTITLLITIAWQCLGFFIAWTLQFDKITDFTGGSNFFILALITLLTGQTFYARNIVYGDLWSSYRKRADYCSASVLVMVWSARLAGFLLFRVLKTGSDTRFDDMRSHFFKFAGFWTFQIIWVWIVSLPTVILNSPAVSDPALGGANPSFGTGTDIAGIILFAIGLFWEAVGDIQKYRFKSSKPPKGQPCTKGLWKYSRHPPYFGEIVLHWGLWILCLTPTIKNVIPENAKRAQYAAICAPLLTMLLLFFLSGLPTAEKPAAQKSFLLSYPADKTDASSNIHDLRPQNDSWAQYKAYLARTSIFFPIPPSLYRPLPEFIKRTVLLDLPMYKFDEEKDGRKALEEERKKNRHEV